MDQLDDNDPILTLSDQIMGLCRGQRVRTIIAALAACLGTVLEQGRTAGDEPPAATRLRNDLRQIVAEVLVKRDGFGRHGRN